MTEKIVLLETAHTQLVQIGNRITAAREERAKLQINVDTQRATIATKQQDLGVMQGRAAQHAALHLTWQAAQVVHAFRTQLDQLQEREAAIERELGEAVSVLDERMQWQDAAQTELDAIEQALLVGQAAHLARQLQTGQPCPVCGAVDHPTPAVAGSDLPSETSLKQQRKLVKQYRKDVDAARERFGLLEQLRTVLITEHRLLVANLGDDAQTPATTLATRVQQAVVHLKDAADALEHLPKLRAAVEQLGNQLEQLKHDLINQDRVLQELDVQRGFVQATVIEREQGIPEALRNRHALEEIQAEVTTRRELLERAFEEARMTHQQLQQNMVAIEAVLNKHAVDKDIAGQKLAEQQRHFALRLSEAGFEDELSYQTAKRSREERMPIEQQIQVFDSNVVAAHDRLERARQAAVGHEHPDLGQLEGTAATAREHLDVGIEQTATLVHQLAQLRTASFDAEGINETVTALESRYRILGHLSKTANGENPYKMTFQRFVLAVLLDEVLINASFRLRSMTNGRYTIQRVVGQQGDRRRAGGLELEVHDVYTDTTRLAKTLSGGESFLASLALALGLADIVQSRAGGTHLNTMFVDEGFGSLDEEALERALDTLFALQQGGRLVGIISHVAELKSRIPARLEVTASMQGSAARFVVG